MFGMLSVNDFKSKNSQNPQRNRVQEYVNHFSQAADFIEKVTNKVSSGTNVLNFANALRNQVEKNVIKKKLSDVLSAQMAHAVVKRQMM